jgi:hypothetical protein
MEMKSKGKMTASRAIVAGVILVGTLLMAVAASAQCGNPGLPQTNSKYHKQAWHQGDRGTPLVLTAEEHDPIVGMWQMIFTSEGTQGIPDGTVVDKTLSHWHADGTEFTDSGFRPPDTSAVCLGVWKNMGDSTYRLNHFGISWDPSNTTGPLGPAQIRANVRLEKDSNEFCGRFTIDQYDESGNLLMHIQGKLSAHRLDINTHIKQLL